MTARENFLQKWTEITNAIDNDYQKLIKSNSTIEEKNKEVSKFLTNYQREKSQLDYYYQLWREEGKIELAKVYEDILKHESKTFNLQRQLKAIKDNNCKECKKKTNNPYVFNHTTRKIKQWNISKVSEFSSDENFWNIPVLFCSDNCFQKSFYSKSRPKKDNKPKLSKKTKSPSSSETRNSQRQSQKYLCWECGEERNGRPFATKDTLDVCSENCYREKFGEMCNQCASRCLTYYQDQARPNIIYCPDCYQKNQQEEQSTTYCHYCNDKSDGFYTCDKEECINKMTKEAEKSQLQQSIAELENKPHKTQEEEAELDRKKKELARLNNQQSQPQKEKNQWIKPALLIGSVVLVSGLVIYLINKKKRD